MKLSQERARYVTDYVTSVGDFQIEANYKGESDPLFPNTSEANRIKNRRVAITIKSKNP